MTGETRTYTLIGGDGFIGYHLCRALRRRRDPEIVSYDAHKRFLDSRPDLYEAYLDYRQRQTSDVTRVSADATDRARLEETLHGVEPDIVVYLAALPIATVANDQPRSARRNILDGLQAVLDILRDAPFNPERVVYLSSSMVYGDFEVADGSVVPAHEESTCDPKGVYGTTKLAGEMLVRAYHRQYGLPYTIVRPAAVYGPTDCNRRVTEIFLTRALRGEPLRLDNGGTQMLDFTYVRDLVSGLVRASTTPRAANETFNMTYGEGYTIRELATIVQDLVSDTETYTEQRERTRPRRGPLDISRARSKLGYDPEFSLRDGLQQYLAFIREERFDSLIRR